MAFILLTTSFSNAQENQTMLDTAEYMGKKNELWVNGMTVVLALANQPLYFPHYSLMYKRNIGKYWLRIGAQASPPIDMYEYGMSRIINDSTIVERYRINNRFNAGARIGIEYRKQWKIFTPFIAFDAVFDYTRNRRDIYDATYSIANQPVFPDVEIVRSGLISKSDRLFTSKRETFIYGIGVAAGLILPISEKWAISTQAYMLAGLSDERLKNQNFITGESFRSTAFNFDMDQRLIHEINLIFRF